jgi:putative oxidoreductase
LGVSLLLQLPYDPVGGVLQRLFSSFAGGWAGAGVLLQRILTAILLARSCIIGLAGAPFSLTMIPHLIGGCAAILLLIGLWTPIVGVLIVIIELWVVLNHISDPGMPILLATLSGTAAMIGPGAWSIDARLFGRKHIKT